MLRQVALALLLMIANGQFDGQPAPLSPIITWNEGSYLPVRAEIAVDNDDLVARGVQFGDVRIVYSYRHAGFQPTCSVIQNEQFATGRRASLPLLFDDTELVAVVCVSSATQGISDPRSNTTAVSINVRRFQGYFYSGTALMLIVLAAIVIAGLYTSYCLSSGAAFSTPAIVLALYPSLAAAYLCTAGIDFNRVSNQPLETTIGLTMFLYVLLCIGSGFFFWIFDMSAQRRADYKFRRWSDKFRCCTWIVGCCACLTGPGCYKVLYSRICKLYPCSPDFKAPPGFVPLGHRAGAVGAPGGGTAGFGNKVAPVPGGLPPAAAAAAAASSAGAGATAGSDLVDASGRPAESFDLDSPIPPHASWRLDVLQLFPSLVLFVPPLAVAVRIELGRDLPVTMPLMDFGVIGVCALGLLLIIILLIDVLVLRSPERHKQRRRLRALQLGGRNVDYWKTSGGAQGPTNDGAGESKEDFDKLDLGSDSSEDELQAIEAKMKKKKKKKKKHGDDDDEPPEVEGDLTKKKSGEGSDGESDDSTMDPQLRARRRERRQRRAWVHEQKRIALARSKWDREFGLAAYGDPENKEAAAAPAAPHVPSAAERAAAEEDRVIKEMEEQAEVARRAQAKQERKAARRDRRTARKERKATRQAESAEGGEAAGEQSEIGELVHKQGALEVYEVGAVPLPGGGRARGRREVRIQGTTVDGKTVGVSGPEAREATMRDPSGLDAARRSGRSAGRPEGGGGRAFDDDVRSNPFHPLHTETTAGASGPRGHSAVRSAMGGGVDQEGALGVAAPRVRRGGQEPPRQLDEVEAEDRLAKILDPVQGVGATVERSAARKRQGREGMPGGLQAAVQHGINAQMNAMRGLDRAGGGKFVPSGKRDAGGARGAQANLDDSFDDDRFSVE